MLCEQGDVDETVILALFFNLRDDKGWGNGEFDVHYDPLVCPLTPLVGLNRESMESNLTRLRLPGLKIGDGQYTTHVLASPADVLRGSTGAETRVEPLRTSVGEATHALCRKLTFRASLLLIGPQQISVAI